MTGGVYYILSVTAVTKIQWPSLTTVISGVTGRKIFINLTQRGEIMKNFKVFG